MHLNEVAISAALKGEKDVPTRHRFRVTDESVTIERRSRMGNSTTELKFGVAVTKSMTQGTKKMTASRLDDGSIQIAIEMPIIQGLVKITDTRIVGEDDLLKQTLTTTRPHGATVVTTTTRYYKRCLDPGPVPGSKEWEAAEAKKKAGAQGAAGAAASASK